MIEGSQALALIYRIYYKCMKTNLNVKALNKSPKHKIVLIQSSTSDANIQVPKTILWKDINLPRQWILQNEIPQRPVSNNIMNLSNMQQYLDGSVRISFNERFRRHLTLDELPTPSETSSSIPTRKDTDLLSKISTQNIKLKSVLQQGQVSHPCYEPNETLNSDDDSRVSPTSPTQSDFEVKPPIHHQLRVTH